MKIVGPKLIVTVVAFCLISNLGFAQGRSRNWRETRNEPSREVQPATQPQETVRSYIQIKLGLDPAKYDLGFAIQEKLKRLEIEGDWQGDEQLLRDIHQRYFSKFSEGYLEELVMGMQVRENPNALILGQAGVGKSYLINQLAWMFGYNIMPDSLRAKLNIIDPESPAAKAAADFFGRTNVILVDEQLLLQQGKQTGAANSEKSRMKIVLSELFEAARREYAKGMGNRTIFVFDEVALLNDEVLHEFKRLSDNGGYSPRGYRDLDSKDGGYHIIGLTTFAEYQRMLKGDSALDRRFRTKVKVQELPDEKVKEIVRHRAASIWHKHYHGIDIHDEAIDFLIHMKRFLQWPPLAAPDSVLSAAELLYSWKSQNPGQNQYLINLEDAQKFLQEKLGLSSIWFKGPNGEPAMHGLAGKVKEYVVGQDEVVETIAHIITTWWRTGMNGPPPIIFLGGETGSGKDTIVMAFNKVLFGNPGNDLIFNMAGQSGFGVDSILFGPPTGNHSDDRPGKLQEVLDKIGGRGFIALNEVYDLPPAEFEKFKVLVEQGVIKPAGLDARELPLLFPIFFLGQFGENETRPIDVLTTDEIDALFTTGKGDEKIGAVPQALLDRARQNGGVFILNRVPTEKYQDILRIWLRSLIADLKKSNQITLTVDDALIDSMVNQAKRTGLRIRAMYSIMIDYTRGAISKAADEGLPLTNVHIHITIGDGGSGVQIIIGDKTFKFEERDLLRTNACPQAFN